jgi:predicted DNA-binding transcriptional regulator AlpA
MRFAPREIDQDTFLTLAGSGYSFTYNFQGNRRKPELFLNTPVIIYDIDHCEQPMEDYIDGLHYKPSLGYTSYSNGKDGKFSFRLVYVFDSLIESEQSFNALYYGIAGENGFGKEFDKRRINQLYFGSNKDLPGYKEYNSHLVYSQDDFDFPEESAVCPISMSNTLSPHNNDYETNDTFQDGDDNYYRNYVESLETPLVQSTSGTHYTYPQNYYSVPIRIITKDGKRVVKRWTDGEHRRKKLYISALIMLLNKPSLSPDNLRFNLRQLIRDYYDMSKDPITQGDIEGIVKRAYENKDTCQLDNSIHQSNFKVNKEYCQEQGLSARQLIPAIIKERNMEIMDFYDWTTSVSNNLKMLNEDCGLAISRSTLYRYVNEICPQPKRDIDKEIIEAMKDNPLICIKGIASALGKSTSTIRRHIKRMGDRVRKERGMWMVGDNEINDNG